MYLKNGYKILYDKNGKWYAGKNALPCDEDVEATLAAVDGTILFGLTKVANHEDDPAALELSDFTAEAIAAFVKAHPEINPNFEDSDDRSRYQAGYAAGEASVVIPDEKVLSDFTDQEVAEYVKSTTTIDPAFENDDTRSKYAAGYNDGVDSVDQDTIKATGAAEAISGVQVSSASVNEGAILFNLAYQGNTGSVSAEASTITGLVNYVDGACAEAQASAIENSTLENAEIEGNDLKFTLTYGTDVSEKNITLEDCNGWSDLYDGIHTAGYDEATADVANGITVNDITVDENGCADIDLDILGTNKTLADCYIDFDNYVSKLMDDNRQYIISAAYYTDASISGNELSFNIEYNENGCDYYTSESQQNINLEDVDGYSTMVSDIEDNFINNNLANNLSTNSFNYVADENNSADDKITFNIEYNLNSIKEETVNASDIAGLSQRDVKTSENVLTDATMENCVMSAGGLDFDLVYGEGDNRRTSSKYISRDLIDGLDSNEIDLEKLAAADKKDSDYYITKALLNSIKDDKEISAEDKAALIQELKNILDGVETE